jgi:Putative restriction endonuclease
MLRIMDIAHPRVDPARVSDTLEARGYHQMRPSRTGMGRVTPHYTLPRSWWSKTVLTRLALGVHMHLTRGSRTLRSASNQRLGGAALLPRYHTRPKRALPQLPKAHSASAARNLNRRPDVAFVSYAPWTTSVMAREPAWNVVPDLAIEIVSPTNLAEEIDRKITDYIQAEVRLVWVFYPDSGRVYVYQRRRTSAFGTHRYLGWWRGTARLSATHCPIVRSCGQTRISGLQAPDPRAVAYWLVEDQDEPGVRPSLWACMESIDGSMLRHCRVNLLVRRRLPKNAAAPDQDKNSKCLQDLAARSEFAATVTAHLPKVRDWRTALPCQRD